MDTLHFNFPTLKFPRIGFNWDISVLDDNLYPTVFRPYYAEKMTAVEFKKQLLEICSPLKGHLNIKSQDLVSVASSKFIRDGSDLTLALSQQSS
ncbi:hypothetical protein QE152_g26925 [Popillia japonica]|uniref:Uncharacterized protein n=1 Tax=Popillia japonica TaxID=7064 RepID=A0AAW1JW54_POPJA